MTQVPHFGRVLTAMITPFTVNGELDVNEAVKLAKWLQEQGNDGLVVTGTTGEASTLTDAEKSQRPTWYIPLRINLTVCLSLGLLAISALHFNHHI